MKMCMLALAVGSCASVAMAGNFVPVSQTRSVHTYVRAVNSSFFIDVSDTDDDAAVNFGPFVADITSNATAASMQIAATSKQDSSITPHEITGGGTMHGSYTPVPGGTSLYETNSSNACTIVFDLTEATHVDFTASLLNPPLTSFLYVAFRGPTGFLANALPPPVGSPNAEFHGVLPAGRYRIEALYEHDSGAFAPIQASNGTPQGWSFSLTTPPPPACDGDTNGDNQVNGADLSVLLANFGMGATGAGQGDFNGDGVCNGADLSVLLANFGESC